MKHYKRIALLYAATTLLATVAAYWICAGTYYHAIFGQAAQAALLPLFYSSMAQSVGLVLGAVAVILLLGMLFLRRYWRKLGEELADLDAELASLFESCQDALIDFDAKGLILRANFRAFELAGLEPDELVGRHAGDVLRLPSGQRLDAFGWPPVFDDCGLSGNPAQLCLLRTDGLLAPVLCIASEFRREGLRGLRLHLEDLSERRKLETALQQREQSLALLSAASFEGLAITDGQDIIEGNLALCRTFGYDSAHLSGLALEQLFALESREILRRRLTAPMEGAFELRAQHAEGHQFQCLVSLKTIPFGNTTVVAAALRDVTESKQAERVIQQYQRREAELAAIQKTAATCSHEINNPLTGLLVTLQMLLEEVQDGEQQSMLRDSLDCTQRIREVLAQMEKLTNPKYRQYSNSAQILDLRSTEPVAAGGN